VKFYIIERKIFVNSFFKVFFKGFFKPKLSDFFKPQRTQRIVSYLKYQIKSVSSLCSHVLNTSAKILYCYHLMSAQSKAKKRGYSLILPQISSVPSVVNRLF